MDILNNLGKKNTEKDICRNMSLKLKSFVVFLKLLTCLLLSRPLKNKECLSNQAVFTVNFQKRIKGQVQKNNLSFSFLSQCKVVMPHVHHCTGSLNQSYVASTILKMLLNTNATMASLSVAMKGQNA